MPTTRRSIGGARGVPAKGQSTLLSFSNKVTKSVPKDTKNAIISPALAKVEVPEPVKEEELAAVIIDEPEANDPEEQEVEKEEEEEEEEVEAVSEVEEVPEKSEAELQAEQITDAQIKKYWKGIEDQWKSPRVHQEGLSLQEKVLRYFDVSSQYGPCIGTPRMKRWQRAERLGLNPPVEVLAVLLKEENKGVKNINTAHMDEILNSSTVGQ
ncbi:DNA polymerase delta, subunit 4-domain-containing protein [Dactylonectria macrodidyma]|uniref:DNA polymerase delta, subunit 4-domain-containing protein n=1 Tax=Dactylonectria macrodidyma TaxID=307937 RepID=A0A9P9FA41_9HYPO|nr:DNA polymerase delta, subunit 4-domain-containing protein [Dactylonectria macrodidyma]